MNTAPEPGVVRIFLVGAMGSGKSALAKVLADALSWSRVDLDRRIVELSGKSIAEIFAQQGEDAFRRLESECLFALKMKERIVVATGGGVVQKEANRHFLRNETGHYTIFLSASIDTLVQRLNEKERKRRPLLRGEDWRNQLAKTFNQRLALWRECADLTVDTDDNDIAGLSRKLQRHLAPLLNPYE